MDIIFLQTRDGNTQIYAVDLDAENAQPVALTDDRATSIPNFDIRGDWPVYARHLLDSPLQGVPPYQDISELVLLNWRTHE